MIQRWGFYATMDGAKLEQCDDGELVKYDDHEAALAAERAKVRELVEALNLAIVHKYTHDGRILLEKYSKEEPNA